ncbi:Tellurite resistance protein [Rubellimicrobium mesophilum DSM 19309]|uniref:Putative gamma-glutamylcyclotransferase n=1 Tax=Rubellimicrobium mesophilum DSM 19309 TaxID=442562 RepID=A0A017HPY7_9RHOB|nr:TrgA family protein [Rubellimicrobium mesophilum]EYD75834.1 Tellurite resistance protein [Rubellimicrobium mesophilum DSM 19309]
MPTAAKLAAAILFGLLAWYVSDLVTLLFPDRTDFGRFAWYNAGLGAVVGWWIAGGRARTSWPNAVAYGITAAFCILLLSLFLNSTVVMLNQSMRRVYEGPVEALLDVVRPDDREVHNDRHSRGLGNPSGRRHRRWPCDRMGRAQVQMTTFFFYGTLRHRPMLDLLAGGTAGGEGRDAVLPGYRVLRSSEGDMPILVEDAESVVRGTLWTGLHDDALERLDAYELPFGYTRRSVKALVDGQEVEAQAYYPPESLDATEEDWSFEGWLRHSLPLPMRRAAEIAAQEPPLAGEALQQQSPMIDHRAAASMRARGAPTSLRTKADAADFAFRRIRPPAGSFFRFEELEVDHRRFDGGRAEGLKREVMVGADAALILPFDEARDRLLLVEQFRLGPARRGDPQPWILEPVAGLVDAGETPEGAARREGQEEAALKFRELVPMFAGYASPGNATDFFYAYLGLCDLPDDHATSGGLESEQEDLKLHLLSFERALDLIVSGEANAMPLISMLLWLDRWRSGRG